FQRRVTHGGIVILLKAELRFNHSLDLVLCCRLGLASSASFGLLTLTDEIYDTQIKSCAVCKRCAPDHPFIVVELLLTTGRRPSRVQKLFFGRGLSAEIQLQVEPFALGHFFPQHRKKRKYAFAKVVMQVDFCKKGERYHQHYAGQKTDRDHKESHEHRDQEDSDKEESTADSAPDLGSFLERIADGVELCYARCKLQPLGW